MLAFLASAFSSELNAMNRSLYVLTALLLACAALAAPAPQPFVSGWGHPIDPDRDCKITRDKGVLTIEMPGGDHDYDTARDRLNAPRFVREFEGDFEIQVRIRIDSLPSAKSTAKDASEDDYAGLGLEFPRERRKPLQRDLFSHPKGLPSFVAAGFLVIPPRPFCELFRRSQYGVAGAGKGKEGFATQLSRDDGGGLGYKACNREWGGWPFEAKPEYVYLRLIRKGFLLDYSISPDGKSWVSIGGINLLGLPSKLTVGLAAYSTSTDPSKIRFDQLKLTQGKKKER
ncbi:MAG TPA: hypothetical protein VH592_10825 [Gemmataceae bacterium]